MRVFAPLKTATLLLSACLILLVVAVGGERAVAAEFPGLYAAQVPVATRDRPERQEALKVGLAQVLARMTGMRQVEGVSELEGILEAASRYVQQYRYVDTSQSGMPYRLHARFDGPALERALSTQGFPLWGRERPAVLLWVAMQDLGDRYLVSMDRGDRARQTLQTVADARGVPVVFPLMDLEDQGQVGFADVSGGFFEPVERASARYRPDALVLVQAYASGNTWRGRWRLSFGGQRSEWESTGASADEALTEGAHVLMDRLAQGLTTTGYSGLSSGAVVSISGVHTLQDYFRASTYLAGLGPVTSSRAYRIAPGVAEFVVQTRGELRDLARIVQLGDTLRPESAPAAPVAAPTAVPGAAVGAEADTNANVLRLRLLP